VLTACTSGGPGRTTAAATARPSATPTTGRSALAPSAPATATGTRHAASPAPAAPAPRTPAGGYAPGPVPALLDTHDVYAAGRPGRLSPATRGQLGRVYVPDLAGGDVTVIDPATYRVVDRFRVGRGPQHVVPSYDLQTLWVNDSLSNDLLPVDPRTGRPRGKAVPVDDPYNVYFTPDGRYALVMAERLHRIDVRDAHTMRLVQSLPVPCRGVNHADFAADGTSFLASCEFDGTLLDVGLAPLRVRRTLALGRDAMPQDVKLSPDGRTYYVADMAAGGVHVLDARTVALTGFVRTGGQAHGLYPSRDGEDLYVSNRTGHSVSVLSFATGRVRATWPVPHGSPDMGGVSADGTVLWLSGRYDDEVYALSTADGRLLARIPVGREPHGLSVWPQPGRFSLGHTGILR
jgi:YVTN family beta-propeller protein